MHNDPEQWLGQLAPRGGSEELRSRCLQRMAEAESARCGEAQADERSNRRWSFLLRAAAAAVMSAVLLNGMVHFQDSERRMARTRANQQQQDVKWTATLAVSTDDGRKPWLSLQSRVAHQLIDDLEGL